MSWGAGPRPRRRHLHLGGGVRYAELCAGYGGLGLAVEQVFGAELAWYSEFDPAASKIMAAHWPDAPNHGDMTRIDWAAVEPVDILSGGTPCQDLSHAGRRQGMTEGTRSNLWVQMREAIAAIRPSLVIWENVRGAMSAPADSALESCPRCVGDPRDRGSVLRALGRVLGDLADLGFDAEWRGLRAADVGACHGRWRVFVIAYPHDAGRSEQRRPVAARSEHRAAQLPSAVQRILPTPVVTDSTGTRNATAGRSPGAKPFSLGTTLGDVAYANRWGDYAAAIHRHEQMLGRPAPSPTEPGRNGNPRLSARFAEWMMCLPDGWVTDTPGITRNEALKALGNGVVPAQAEAAIRHMLTRQEAAQQNEQDDLFGDAS